MSLLSRSPSPARKVVCVLLASILLLQTSGCASKAAALAKAEEASNQIAVDMERTKVLEILGEPWRVKADPSGVLWTYRYEDSAWVVVHVLYWTGIVLLIPVVIGVILLSGSFSGGTGPGGPDSEFAYLRVHMTKGVVDWFEPAVSGE